MNSSGPWSQKVCIISPKELNARPTDPLPATFWLVLIQKPPFYGEAYRNFIGTVLRESRILAAGDKYPTLGREAKGADDEDAKDVLDSMHDPAGLFVFIVAVPVVFKVAGITLGIISLLIGLAVLLIKVAVVLAIGYLILVGIRALLR